VDEELHLIIRHSPDGKVYATSPQAPGLVYGHSSLKELRYDLDDVLSFHFDRPGPFTVVEHHERHYDVADGELVIRMALDAHEDEREEVAARVKGAADLPEQAHALVSIATNVVGEAVYVCAVPTDTLGWLTAQLQSSEDTFNAALAFADRHLLTIPVAVGDDAPSAWKVSPSASKTTLSEVIQQSPVVTPQRSVSLESC
jgi:hypothetical protein